MARKQQHRQLNSRITLSKVENPLKICAFESVVKLWTPGTVIALPKHKHVLAHRKYAHA